jgi:hypothetical protein
MQRNEWLSLILTLIVIVLWVETHGRETDERSLACARDAGDRMPVSHLPGSSVRRCGYRAVGHLSQASSHYPAGRVH